MNGTTHFAGSERWQLRRALLLYQGSGGALATLHDVDCTGKRATLGVGEPVTLDFVRALTDELGASVPAEVLPANVVARTADLVAWWTPKTLRPMYFREGSDLAEVSARHFPHPPLVWLLTGQSLYVRAMKENARPAASTKLYVAPYWNCSLDGRVCLGDMRHPDLGSVEQLDGWVDGFFGSLFTHPNAQKLTRYGKGDVVALWTSLAGSHKSRRRFPLDTLRDAKQTLGQLLKRGGGRA